MRARLCLLVLAHDRAEDSALEGVEGGELQAAEPETKNTVSARGQIDKNMATHSAHSPTQNSKTMAARTTTNCGEGSVARRYLKGEVAVNVKE